ncbi:MAG: hypothetical protein OXE02_08505 [Chloroflexi bacterium]|nr:hypothetical protein [Chloroflexota bacterium]
MAPGLARKRPDGVGGGACGSMAEVGNPVCATCRLGARLNLIYFLIRIGSQRERRVL